MLLHLAEPGLTRSARCQVPQAIMNREREVPSASSRGTLLLEPDEAGRPGAWFVLRLPASGVFPPP
jgi:hypothetical protein